MVWCPGCGVRFFITRWLNAATCAAPLGLVAEVVTAAKTASVCSCERIAVSLACAPYSTVTDWSIRAVDDARAEDSGPGLPVYHDTVFADVPLTRVVALPNGEPPTRTGGFVAAADAPRPSAANAAEFELVTVSFAPVLLFSVITPPLMVDGTVVPVSAS